LRPTLNGDEVKYALTEGAQKGDATNLGSLSEPRRKQTSMPTLNGQRNFHFLLIRPSWRNIVQTIFNYFFRFKSTVGNQMVTSAEYTNNCLVTN